MDTYIDLYKTKNKYETAIKFEAFLLLLNCFFVIKFMRVSPIMSFFFSTLRHSLRIFMFLSIFFILIFLSYAIIATQIWGIHNYGYKDIPNAFLYLLLSFELRVQTPMTRMYNKLANPSEKFFGFLHITAVTVTILTLSISTAVVIKAFEKENMLLQASINKGMSLLVCFENNCISAFINPQSFPFCFYIHAFFLSFCMILLNTFI